MAPLAQCGAGVAGAGLRQGREPGRQGSSPADERRGRDAQRRLGDVHRDDGASGDEDEGSLAAQLHEIDVGAGAGGEARVVERDRRLHREDRLLAEEPGAAGEVHDRVPEVAGAEREGGPDQGVA